MKKSLMRGKGVDGALVVGQVRMKVVRRDREGVWRAAEQIYISNFHIGVRREI